MKSKADPKQRRGVRFAVLLSLVAGLVVAAWMWRSGSLEEDGPTSPPVRPALAARHATLAERVAQAEALARSSRTRFQGIAELGRLYHANGYTAAAEACWTLLIEQEPGEPRWGYYLALLRLAAGDYDEATGRLRATLAQAPDYTPAALHLAQVQLKTGDFEGAERNFRHRLALLPLDPYARLGLARVALQQAQTAEAKTLLEAIIKDSPHFSTAHNLYAQLCDAAGDAPRARWHRWLGTETLRYADAPDPWIDELQPWCFDYDRLCVLGSIESLREHHPQARALYEQAIQLEPASPGAYQLLGVHHLERNEPAAARDLLEQARSRVEHRDAATLLPILSRAYRDLKQPIEALSVARQGVEQFGVSAELLEAAGLALAELGRHEEATQSYRAALDLNPNDASLCYNLAVSLLALRQLDEVLEALDRSLTLRPTFPPTLLLRGKIELSARHWDAAERYLRPLFESHPDNAEARSAFAEWHRHKGAQAESDGDPQLAEQHYRNGLAVEPEDAELQVSLGVLYLVQRRFSDAVAPLEAYHRLQPESPPGCLFLGQALVEVGQREQAREVLQRGVALSERSGNARTARACRELLSRL